MNPLESILERLRNEDEHYATYNAVHNVLKETLGSETSLTPFRIHFLRNYTVEGLVPVLVGGMALSRVGLQVSIGEYDNIQQEIMDPRSDLHQKTPDAIALGLWLESLSPSLSNRFNSLLPAAAEDEVLRVITIIEGYVKGIRKHTQKPILLNNFPLLRRPTLGILESSQFGFTKALNELNLGLEKIAQTFQNVFIVDFKTQFALLGSHHSLDERYWQMARAPLSQTALVSIGKEYNRFLKSFVGKTKKCLVLDCDNTLWGGIVGEDGINGIKLGKDFPGSCFISFQQEILNLHDRGVILALCSKNNESDVMEVLKNHPEMLIREQHLSRWKINWEDKATNLTQIAKELNIGLDSLVFVDDSAFECAGVRDRLPEVTVIQLPKATSTYRSILSSSGLFDSLTFSEEDRNRTKMYRSEEVRKKLNETSDSLEDFLHKLGLQAEIGKPTAKELQRVSQLTQKTNQFNLTTQRYTESEIQSFLNQAQYDVFYMKLKDNVDDLGIIGVAIVRYEQQIAEIDSFLLSCRALGRGAEDALMASVFKKIQARNAIQVVHGKHLKTAKNVQMTEFYARFGFESVSNSEKESSWKLPVEKIKVHYPAWLKVNEIKENP